MSRKKISEAGQTTGGGLACPKCAGTTFKSKRSALSKLITIPTVGVGAAVIPKRWVKCETCGATFKRG